MDYSDYTITTSDDPSVWGSDCSEKQARRAVKLEIIALEKQFPGAKIETSHSNHCPVSGPDENVLGTIQGFINDNWLKYLS